MKMSTSRDNKQPPWAVQWGTLITNFPLKDWQIDAARKQFVKAFPDMEPHALGELADKSVVHLSERSAKASKDLAIRDLLSVMRNIHHGTHDSSHRAQDAKSRAAGEILLGKMAKHFKNGMMTPEQYRSGHGITDEGWVAVLEGYRDWWASKDPKYFAPIEERTGCKAGTPSGMNATISKVAS